jgi:hypothetical protein
MALQTPATTAADTPTVVPTASSADLNDADETPAERRERLHTAPFGSRFLTDEADVFSHNAWDHVTPPPEWEDDAKRVLDMQRQAQVSKEMKCTSRPVWPVVISHLGVLLVWIWVRCDAMADICLFCRGIQQQSGNVLASVLQYQ